MQLSRLSDGSTHALVVIVVEGEGVALGEARTHELVGEVEGIALKLFLHAN